MGSPPHGIAGVESTWTVDDPDEQVERESALGTGGRSAWWGWQRLTSRIRWTVDGGGSRQSLRTRLQTAGRIFGYPRGQLFASSRHCGDSDTEWDNPPIRHQ